MSTVDTYLLSRAGELEVVTKSGRFTVGLGRSLREPVGLSHDRRPHQYLGGLEAGRMVTAARPMLQQPFETHVGASEMELRGRSQVVGPSWRSFRRNICVMMVCWWLIPTGGGGGLVRVRGANSDMRWTAEGRRKG